MRGPAAIAAAAPRRADAARAPRRAEAAVLPRTTHRLLLMRGFDPVQAANLTAFINGIPLGGHAWSLSEVNRLLFLRDVAHRPGWEH